MESMNSSYESTYKTIDSMLGSQIPEPPPAPPAIDPRFVNTRTSCTRRMQPHRWSRWTRLTPGMYSYLGWTGGRYTIQYRQCRSCNHLVTRKKRILRPFAAEFSRPVHEVSRPWMRVAFVIITLLPMAIIYAIGGMVAGIIELIEFMSKTIRGER